MDIAWDRFMFIKLFKISSFQLKNSNANIMLEKVINHIYHSSHFTFTYIDSIYRTEKRIKNRIEYTIARGKTGIWYGTGVKGWLYETSIQKVVSLQ